MYIHWILVTEGLMHRRSLVIERLMHLYLSLAIEGFMHMQWILDFEWFVHI